MVCKGRSEREEERGANDGSEGLQKSMRPCEGVRSRCMWQRRTPLHPIAVAFPQASHDERAIWLKTGREVRALCETSAVSFPGGSRDEKRATGKETPHKAVRQKESLGR